MNEDIKKKLKNFTVSVNNSLSDYLVLHNRLIKESGGFMSIFKKINFEEYYNNSSLVAKKLILISDNIDKFNNSIQLDIAEKEFIMCLFDYASALLKAIQALIKISYDLWQKSLGNKDKNISWKNNKSSWNDYEKYRTEYVKLGERLNSLYKSIN